MDTRNREIVPLFEHEGKMVILLEKYELGMSKVQLKRIKLAWEAGTEIEDIIESEKRHPVEVIVALLELSIQGRIKRPFAYRKVI